MSPEVKECLKTLFEICQELMKENNETNPWEISLSAFILPIISGINDEIENEVKDLLEKVKRCDPQRREIYTCLRPLAGLIRLYTESTDNLPFVIQAERRWFLTVNGE
uniref:Geranylgeranyl transferase type-2 subunit alpha n=1 Tax=Panagrolaimus sp. PS1159 TaxID=55785 RepID=A0AC35G7X8_9BILA